MAFTGLQKFLHYPLEQDDPESKANDMISEFPGAFCGTLYHSLSKKTLQSKPEGSNLFPIDCTNADYLVDVTLHIQMPEETLPPKIGSFVPKIIESVEIQWVDARGTLQNLKSTTVDDNFRWRYRGVLKTITIDDVDQAVIVVKLPWFFSKKLQSAIPLFYLRGLNESTPIQIKVNFTEGYNEYKATTKVNVVAEYAHITDDEREFYLDEKANKNPHRRKRIIYEEVPLSQMKMPYHVVRMSWVSAETVVDVTNPLVKDQMIHLDPKKTPEIHWECFGNEWARDSQRFSYSISATPDRAQSTVLSSTPFSNIKITQTGEGDDIRFVVQKIVLLAGNAINLYY